jgi:hypothetical protein
MESSAHKHFTPEGESTDQRQKKGILWHIPRELVKFQHEVKGHSKLSKRKLREQTHMLTIQDKHCKGELMILPNNVETMFYSVRLLC